MPGDNAVLPAGKLNSEHLAELLTKYAPSDPRLIVGPGIGEDAAVIDCKDTFLVLKTDPITFVEEDAGWYAVNINANDIACTGASPKWFLATLLLPTGATSRPIVDTIFEEINTAASELGITVCGGHVEVTDAVTRPTIVGSMIGEAPRDRLVDKKNTEPGDRIILTKGIAVEAISVIARARGKEVEARFGKKFLERALNAIRDPGISVVRDASTACGAGIVKAMHDPTEGGLATGLKELAEATGLGIRVDTGRIPLLDDAKALCKEFHLDIMGAIASGSLLIVTDSGSEEKILSALESEGISAGSIGEMTEEKDMLLGTEGKWKNLPEFERDEIVKLFEG